MRVVYIAHPLTPTESEINALVFGGRVLAPLPRAEALGVARRANLNRAERWLLWAARIRDVAPIAPWIPLARSWDESERERGLAIDLAVVARCDEVWLLGGRVSGGMQLEAERARTLGIAVLDLTHLGEEPPNV